MSASRTDCALVRPAARVPLSMEQEVGLIVLGEGKLEHEARLQELAEEHHDRLRVLVGYSEDLAHRIQAGSDIFLMSRLLKPGSREA